MIIIDKLIKIVYYRLIKVIINILGFAKVIIIIIVKYYHFLNLIIINPNLLFI